MVVPRRNIRINAALHWLDERAAVVSNMRKPESDNSYGKAATIIRDLLREREELLNRIGSIISEARNNDLD